jgi:Amino acid permease
VVMGTLLGVMFLGLSMMDAKMKVPSFTKGTPTVISQIGDLAYGHSLIGHVLFYSLQAGTMLILVLAANTSFADFPRLASFHAGDSFMPRQLTKRGHRLVFSSGIIFLATTAAALVLVTEAKVDRLIPLYAIGVFTSFTLSQAGMAKHHITHKEEGWRKGLFVNGFGAFLSAVIDLVIAYEKFWQGAWFIILLVPVMVVFLFRLSEQYELEDEQLARDVPAAIKEDIYRRHVVLVFVDRLDLAAARAIHYARTLMPDELRAVHFALDQHEADALRQAWTEHGMSQIALDLVDCPDRRLTRTAVETVARDLAAGRTEVTVLLPERKYSGVWHRILHDQTADGIIREVSLLPHANVTTVPFHLDTKRKRRADIAALAAAIDQIQKAADPAMAEAAAAHSPNGHAVPVEEDGVGPSGPVTSTALTVSAVSGNGSETGNSGARTGVVPIASVRWRERCTIEGKVRTLRVQPLAGSSTLECVVEDSTGAISVVFYGRPKVAGVQVGSVMRVQGTAAQHHGRLAFLNPAYELRPKTH